MSETVLKCSEMTFSIELGRSASVDTETGKRNESISDGTMTTPDALLASIAAAGRTLVFCDESDLTIETTSTMCAEIHAWVGLEMPSHAYSALANAVSCYQADHGVPEFHGNEIVNAGSKSAWKLQSFERRLDAFRFACDLVIEHAASLLTVHIAAEQYQVWVDEGQVRPGSHRRGVKEVFAKSIIEHLADRAPALLIFDKDKNNPGPTLLPVPNAHHLAGGGILIADSNAVAGLQIADVAACAIGRYLKRRDRLLDDTANAFDRVAEKMLEDLPRPVHSLLD